MCGTNCLLWSRGGTSTGEEGHSTGRVNFFPNGTGDPPLSIVQTKDRIDSCSNLQSDLKNVCFCKSYVDIRTRTHTDLASLVSMVPSLSEYPFNCCKHI